MVEGMILIISEVAVAASEVVAEVSVASEEAALAEAALAEAGKLYSRIKKFRLL